LNTQSGWLVVDKGTKYVEESCAYQELSEVQFEIDSWVEKLRSCYMAHHYRWMGM
jgi:hypothetical protein